LESWHGDGIHVGRHIEVPASDVISRAVRKEIFSPTDLEDNNSSSIKEESIVKNCTSETPERLDEVLTWWSDSLSNCG
jgi:hypothetical protein